MLWYIASCSGVSGGNKSNSNPQKSNQTIVGFLFFFALRCSKSEGAAPLRRSVSARWLSGTPLFVKRALGASRLGSYNKNLARVTSYLPLESSNGAHPSAQCSHHQLNPLKPYCQCAVINCKNVWKKMWLPPNKNLHVLFTSIQQREVQRKTRMHV